MQIPFNIRAIGMQAARQTGGDFKYLRSFDTTSYLIKLILVNHVLSVTQSYIFFLCDSRHELKLSFNVITDLNVISA